MSMRWLRVFIWLLARIAERTGWVLDIKTAGDDVSYMVFGPEHRVEWITSILDSKEEP